MYIPRIFITHYLLFVPTKARIYYLCIIYIYKCIYIHIYILYMCIHTHTHIHIYIFNKKRAPFTGVLISPQPDQEGNKLQRKKILMFIYPIYNHNWRNISTSYIYIKQDQHQTKYSHHQTKYIGKQVGLRTYQHPSTSTLGKN